MNEKALILLTVFASFSAQAIIHAIATDGVLIINFLIGIITLYKLLKNKKPKIK